MLENRFLPLNLQFFAEQGEDEGDQTSEQSGGNEEQSGTDSQQQSEEKTFRQEDVNNIVAREAKKAQEKLLKQLGIEDFENAKEGFQKFKEWQDQQKTEQEKQAEQLEQLQDNLNQTTTENETLKAQLSALKQGVIADSVEDVVALAKNYVSDDVDMEAAIKQVIEKYPHFAQKQEEQDEPKPQFTTGQHQSDGNVITDPFKQKLAKYK
ncbi:putative RNase H-like nuclease (RuvC/YqgF family) [Cerasibacillus quisquiliarum]|uniref:Scaffold protein n=1 Tax=Cerasibacillus quisquiliarum TaxID=227865 RepID=A0A511UUH7_9BACI|nr:hypothetical protein [Cerasibacillus quisquiliarum]MBB5144868.1 putative RNase H-like nuclease (RuvC/YqgF family) [Cerasibacillus quisquiliarum]GEN30240.1 hypothetical protein CQU01_04780 [Cerasibacillus quisquiliarum]